MVCYKDQTGKGLGQSRHWMLISFPIFMHSLRTYSVLGGIQGACVDGCREVIKETWALPSWNLWSKGRSCIAQVHNVNHLYYFSRATSHMTPSFLNVFSPSSETLCLYLSWNIWYIFFCSTAIILQLAFPVMMVMALRLGLCPPYLCILANH